MALKVPPFERLTSSFRQLASASDELNNAAQELGQVIATVETALKTIKIQVSAWHTVAAHDDNRTGNFWSREIGYSKIGNDWCIAIRRQWGNQFSDGDANSEETWKFSDAPRWMCIEAIGKIPDLLEELIKRTQNTTKDLKTKTEEAKQLAATMMALAAEISQAGER